MGETTEQLRRDIEVTREEIGRDVDALAYKASPSRMVHERVERTKSGLGRLRDRVMGTAGSTGPGVRSRMSSAAGTVQETTGSAVGTVQDTAAAAASQVQGAADEVVARARSGTEGNPLAAGLVAFSAGWLIGSLLPSTDVEAQAAQRATGMAREYGEPVVEQAKQAAGEVGQAMKEPMRQAADEVKSTATEGAQQVKEQGTESVREVRHTTAGQARR